MLGYGIGLTMVVYVFWYFQPSLYEVKDILSQADRGLLGISIVLIPLIVWARAWRWESILSGLGLFVRSADVFRLSALGMSLGLVSPAQLGELGRGYYLKRMGYPIVPSMVSVIYDRISDFFFEGLIGVLGLIVLLNVSLSVEITLIALVALPGILAAAFFIRRSSGIVLAWIKRRWDLDVEIPLPGKPFLWAVIYKTVLASGVRITATVLLAQAVGIHIPLIPLTIIVVVAALIKALPFSIAGIGTRDVFLVHALTPFGVAPESAVAFSTLTLVYILLSTLFGLIVYFGKKR